MEPKSGYNRRITEILLRYWLDLRDEREMPQEKEINPANLVDVWGNCFLVQMTNAAAYGGYRYTYLGKDLVDAFGEDVSREDAEMLVSLPSMRVTSKFDQAVGMRKPLIDEGEFLNGKKSLSNIVKFYCQSPATKTQKNSPTSSAACAGRVFNSGYRR